MTHTAAQKKPAIQDWHPADVIAELRKIGWSLAQLGLQHGYVNRQSLAQALHKPYPKAEAIIAAALNLQPLQIWPSRYNVDGTPNRTRGMKPMRPAHIRIVSKDTPPARGGNPQNPRGR